VYKRKTQRALIALHKGLGFTTELEDYGSSFFDELWRSKGRTIRYHQYLKKVCL